MLRSKYQPLNPEETGEERGSLMWSRRGKKNTNSMGYFQTPNKVWIWNDIWKSFIHQIIFGSKKKKKKKKTKEKL